MRRFLPVLLALPVLFSGCVPERDSGLSDVSPQTFESLPFAAGGILCRTPVPVPSLRVVSRTIRSLAGAEGRIQEAVLPSGMAFGVWTSEGRSREIRNYVRSLSRGREVRVSVRLTRVDRTAPYLLRTFPVKTRHAFMAARWREGDRVLAVRGFFMRSGPHIVPVFSLEESSPGWFSCRTETPGDSGERMSFGQYRATVRAGMETLRIDWGAKNAQR